MNRTSKILIGAAVVVLVLLIILGSVYFVTGGGDREWVVFRDVNPEEFPEVPIITLTEEDYQKYPMLKDIPKTLDVDKSIFAPFLTNLGFVEKETAHQIWETYGDYSGHEYFIEHEGSYYRVGLIVT